MKEREEVVVVVVEVVVVEKFLVADKKDPLKGLTMDEKSAVDPSSDCFQLCINEMITLVMMHHNANMLHASVSWANITVE